MDNLDFLDGQEPAPVDAPTPEISSPDGPARGPDGKFMSAAPTPEPEITPEPALAAPQPEPQTPIVPPGYVPVSALQDLRKEIKALKQPTPAPEPVAIPDPYEDPQGYAQYHQTQTHQATLNIKLDISEDMARQRHGDEPVDQARDWALQRMAQSPSFRDEVLSNRNPYEFVIQAFQRDQIVTQLTPEDLASFKAWQLAQAGAVAQPAAAPAAIPQPTPPRSQAGLPSAGSSKPGEQPVGPGVAFDAVFTR